MKWFFVSAETLSVLVITQQQGNVSSGYTHNMVSTQYTVDD